LPRLAGLCDRLLARALADVAEAVELLGLASALFAPTRPRVFDFVARRFDAAVRLPEFAACLSRETILELLQAGTRARGA